MSVDVAGTIAFTVWVILAVGYFVFAFVKLRQKFPDLKWNDLKENEQVIAYSQKIMKWPAILIFVTFIVNIIFLIAIGISNTE